jgi:hypothetical protein
MCWKARRLRPSALIMHGSHPQMKEFRSLAVVGPIRPRQFRRVLDRTGPA